MVVDRLKDPVTSIVSIFRMVMVRLDIDKWEFVTVLVFSSLCHVGRLHAVVNREDEYFWHLLDNTITRGKICS